MDPAWTIRTLTPDDSLEDLTELLHRAYAPLAERGLRYLATYQDVETPRARKTKGRCFVACVGTTLVGTITLYPPRTGLNHGNLESDEPEWYQQPGVAGFGQYGVEPAWKGQGIGRALHATVEQAARDLGAVELACDTAAPATALIEMYARWGYRVVAETRWDVTNYRSVILSKQL